MAKKLGNRVGKQQLGSGIDALFSRNKVEEEIDINPEGLVRELSSHFAMIPLAEIERNPDQPRKEFDEAALQELAESIRVHNIIQPLTVRRMAPRQYQIISGERRWRASRLAGLEEVPAFIRIANDQELLEMALIENIQREDLNAMEIAYSYYRLKNEFELTHEKLADRVGKDRSTITNYLRLLELHPDVVNAIKTDAISMGHARAIAGLSDKLLQKEFLQKILANNWSVREAERHTKSFKTGEKPKAAPKEQLRAKLSADEQKMLEDFRAFFGTGQLRIQVDDAASGRGQIVIPFKDHQQLTEFFKCIEQ